MAYLFKKNFFFPNGRTNEQTDERTNERTDGRSDYFMPQILFGGIKIPGNPCIYILKRFGHQKDNHEPIKKE